MSSASYATPEAFARLGLSKGEWSTETLTERLAAASRWLRATQPSIQARIDNDDLDRDLVSDTVCNVVARTVPSPVIPLGVDSSQLSAGVFGASVKATNPHGDFYLTKPEKIALGIRKNKAWSMDPLAGRNP